MIRDKDTSEYLNQPAVYKWFLKKTACEQYGIPYDNSTKDSEDYVEVYVGIANNMRQRANWHWNQKFKASSVRAGAISTLNQTIAAILDTTYTENDYDQVKAFQHQNMKLQVYQYCSSKKEAEDIEKKLISTLRYALNIRDNSQHPFCSQLKAMRSSCKKRSFAKI